MELACTPHTARKFLVVLQSVESLAWILVAPNQKSFGSTMELNSNIPHHCFTKKTYFCLTDRADCIALMRPTESDYGEQNLVETAPAHPLMAMAKSISAPFTDISIFLMQATMASGSHESVSSPQTQNSMLKCKARQRLLTDVSSLAQLKNSIVLGNISRWTCGYLHNQLFHLPILPASQLSCKLFQLK